MMLYFRGPKALYNINAHGNGIYFATDTKEIIQNGLTFGGDLSEEFNEVSKLAQENNAALLILNGTGEGSVKKQVDDAINVFVNNVTDNGTVDTFKELIDYAANNASGVGDLIVSVNDVSAKVNNQLLVLDNVKTDLTNTKQELLLKIEESEKAIASLSKDVDNKIDKAFSWLNV